MSSRAFVWYIFKIFIVLGSFQYIISRGERNVISRGKALKIAYFNEKKLRKKFAKFSTFQNHGMRKAQMRLKKIVLMKDFASLRR